jgi:hypothetical protein
MIIGGISMLFGGVIAVVVAAQKAIFGYGYTTAVVSMTNLVSNTGVVASDTTRVGTARPRSGDCMRSA